MSSEYGTKSLEEMKAKQRGLSWKKRQLTPALASTSCKKLPMKNTASLSFGLVTSA